jgi:hypothetical protein
MSTTSFPKNQAGALEQLTLVLVHTDYASHCQQAKWQRQVLIT